MNVLFTFSLLVVFFTGAWAQDAPSDSLSREKILAPYLNYFEMPGEEMYVHFNKSRYMTGEGAWFKIYLVDAAGKLPFDVPQNVYAELYDPSGNPVDRQVLYAEKGSAYGVMELPDSIVSGTYTFRAYTNWMRNFSEDHFYTRALKIAGKPVVDTAGLPARPGQQASPPGENLSAGEYDIQFFPEGGQLLSGIINNVGFKITDASGKGKVLEGILKNNRGDTLMRFKPGKPGMGSIAVKPLSGESYYAEFLLPGGNKKIQKVQLPQVAEEGIVLNVQWFYPDKINILLRTNERTFPLLDGREFYLLIHNQGNIARFFALTWNKKPTLKISVHKSLLLNGVNHITLFNSEYQPVADRMIFHEKQQLAKLSVETRLEGDSAICTLLSEDSGGKPLEADVSVSFLPAGTLSGDFNTNIYATLLLESDLQGLVEDPAWYFEEDDFERTAALDHLLLTQGWRKYKWDAIMKGSPPAAVHIFEQGFSIKGKVINAISGKKMEKSQVSVFSPENDLMALVDVDSAGAFVLPDLYLLDSSRVIIGASNAKGRSGFRELEAGVSKPRYEKTAPVLLKPDKDDQPARKDTGSFVLPENTELLEKVTVTEKAIKEEAPFEGSIYSSMNDRMVEITKDNYWQYTSLANLLVKEFNVHITRSPTGNISANMGRGHRHPPALIIDDIPMHDLSWLDMININDVEAVAVNKSVNPMLGVRGGGGSIHIKTRRKAIDWGEKQDPSIKNLLIEGFSAPVAYYMPEYSIPADNKLFSEYAAVYWKPDVRCDSTNGKAVFRFYVPPGIERLQVRAEGISPEGKLIFDERIISIRK